ncbi:PLP-dependent transferase [Lecanosticta acicola]|uniref:PLP-dependent transferase n=1 Tax=Lecanosticta acicola TaxID=111012 RepID=A0AAI8YWS2_9PEZI|nr:PLP-dependent transferase [Lecanosticta acicola]
MPKAHQKRGRRMKRKHEEDPVDAVAESSSNKRRKSDTSEPAQEYLPLDVENQDMSAAYPPVEHAFFGMLSEQEQEYFKQADEMLESNSFATPEDRSIFLANVYREAEGKELKIAHSQSCSRLLERLIRISDATQLKKLFQAFSGNFITLLSHRFASHCAETLFTCAAPSVSEEVKGGNQKSEDPHDVYVSLENLFLHTLAELEGNIGFLLTDRYASHALRILLLVLSGQPLATDSIRALLQSKRKEGVTVGGVKSHEDAASQERTVPESFSTALEKLISDSVAGLDTAKLRALATHTHANPVLQLLVRLELTHYGKQRAKDERSIIRTLLPDDPLTGDCESAAFIGGMVYDPVGSHLVETIIECAPAKLFKSLYNNYFKERLAQYARNEMGTYVDCRILERLGHDDLLEAHEIICPVIPTLLAKQWTSLTRTLIERCAVRDIDTQAIAVQIDQSFPGPEGFDVAKMLKIGSKSMPVDAEAEGTGPDERDRAPSRTTEPVKVHLNILAQAMLIVPGSLSSLILDALIALPSESLTRMAEDFIVTRTLQQALTTKNASIIERRKLVQRFYGRIGDMALDKSASHVVDCIWEGTHGLAFIRERIAEELAENEAALRESAYGRAVWRNWKMDIYKRRRPEWIRQSKMKASNDGFQSFSELDAKTDTDGSKKTPLQLARERHAANKARKEKKEPERGRSTTSRHAHAAARPPTAAAQISRFRPRPGAISNKNKALLDGFSNGETANSQAKTNGVQSLQRAEEAEELLNAVQRLIISFIRAADEEPEASSKSQAQNKPTRSVIVEHHPPEALKDLLKINLPQQGLGKEGFLQMIRKTLQYSVNTWDQGFLDKLYAATTPVGLASDLILSALNTNVHVYQVSPALTVIEKNVGKALAGVFGFRGENSGGVCQPGGSAANSSSIVIARNCMFPETKQEGNGSRKFVLFTSEHGHYSLEKAAQICGFGAKAVRGVEVDERGRMRVDALEAAVRRAREAGETPFYVNATAGTTVLGSFDPLEEISEVCSRHGLWMHVDGSWGGAVGFSPSQRQKLQGIAKADTISICPHKMLNVPLTCSFLLGKDLRQFHRGMTLPAGYLFHHTDGDEEVWDLADLTPQCGRRGDSFKLAMSWIFYGTDGFAAHIDHAFSVAAHLADLVQEKAAFTLVSEKPPPCLQVCFYFDRREGDAGRNSRMTEAICRELMLTRGFMVDFAPGEEGKFLRVVVNGQTRRETVEGLVRAVEEVGTGLQL